MRRDPRSAAIWLLVVLTLSACSTPTGTPSAAQLLLVTPAQLSVPCETCAQATLAVALTQDKNNADNQAAAAAEVVRANAQATLNSANATLSAVQTQQQNDANVIAAQIAGTAEIVRANAQATLNSAGSTQSAALTADAIRQTLCVFPTKRSNLAQAVSELHLKGRHPVIVLIGGEIDEPQAEVTRRAIQTISRTAEAMNAVVICGGTDMGVMAEIGQIRQQNGYQFPLVGVTPEELVAWPGGPRNAKFLW